MKPLLFASLRAIIKALVGVMNYEQVQTLVNRMESVDLSGDEKRVAVIQEARTIGLAVGYALLNLAIEVAVNTLRSRT